MSVIAGFKSLLLGFVCWVIDWRCLDPDCGGLVEWIMSEIEDNTPTLYDSFKPEIKIIVIANPLRLTVYDQIRTFSLFYQVFFPVQ